MTNPPHGNRTGTSDSIKDSRRLDRLTSPYDELVAKMQTPEAQAGALAAFNATPKELGELAARAATRTKSTNKV